MVSYSADVLKDLAGQLYQQARSIEISHTVLGGLLGLGGSAFMSTNLQSDSVLLYVLGVLGGSGLGLAVARPKAFMLRVQAQTTLCQVKIEENTAREG